MSQRRYPPARLRFLKARLSILVRPSFLVAIVFLSAVGLVVKEYWTNPDFLKLSQNQATFAPTSSNSQSLLSDEDRAIAADIDNLSVLDYDKEKAKILGATSLDSQNQVKKQNEAQLKKILDLAKKNQKANEIQSTTKSQTINTSSTSGQNPFLKQAQNLLEFKLGPNEQVSNVNNSTLFNHGLQAPQNSLNLGIINSNFRNQNPNGNLKNVLETAINQSNNQSLENPTATTSGNQNILSQLRQTTNNSNLPNPSTNQRLRPNQINPLVDTTVFNQPLNNQVQNPYNNFNNTQLPNNNYNQQNFNNQVQNSYNNFNNNQLRPNNYNQQNFNNQVPNLNYNQQNFNNQVQNPYNNFNNTQLSKNNYNQQNFNNQVQNPYSNFNNNQLRPNNYNQQNFNNQVQNPYSNFNNSKITGNRYSPEIQTRIQNIYNRLRNRNTPNTYSAPNNSINTGFQQSNQQQFNSPYSTQNPTQFPNNY